MIGQSLESVSKMDPQQQQQQQRTGGTAAATVARNRHASDTYGSTGSEGSLKENRPNNNVGDLASPAFKVELNGKAIKGVGYCYGALNSGCISRDTPVRSALMTPIDRHFLAERTRPFIRARALSCSLLPSFTETREFTVLFFFRENA
jgi:hypothetical protein